MAPRLMDPARAAEVLRRAIVDPQKPLTVADASVASGLSLPDAEAGLTWLTSEFKGHLRVTEDGDLIHLFPNGFTKPWKREEALERVGRFFVGAGRFIVRAWLLVVMVSYALLFVALIIGVSLSGKSERNEGPGFGWLGALFRMIADAIFWTFHPFSPLYVDSFAEPRARVRHDGAPKVAFYEKVNRFVFGPQIARSDPHVARARILEEIRARQGAIGLADVMRVSGLPRSEADPLMARLMLDHDGTVHVSEGGGIVYRFEELRKSARDAGRRPPPAWERLPELPPLTGNTVESDLAVALLNGFNLLASGWVIAHGFTLSNLALLFDRHRPPVLPDDGVPLVLGVVPLVFSAALFVLPIVRMLRRVREEKENAAERARLLVLREVVTRVATNETVPDEVLRAVIRSETGQEPTSQEVTRRVVDLGGDVADTDDGQIRYRFAELEADEAAAEEERAALGEAKLGKVIFASDE